MSASPKAALPNKVSISGSESLPKTLRHRPRGKAKSSKSGFWGLSRRAWVLVLVHVLVGLHLLHWRLTGRTWTPMEPSESMQTLELGLINAGFILFVLLVLSTLLLGRFFCGWACHVVAYQDAAAWLLKKLGLKPRPLRSRLLSLVPFGAAFYMFLWPQVARILEGRGLPVWKWHLTTEDFWATFPGSWVTALTFLVDGFLVVWFLGAKGFCTYGCPYGAVFGIAERAAPARIRVNDDCEGCGHCTDVCTSNVRVHEEVARFGAVVDSGCMRCLDCVAACPKDALSLAWKHAPGTDGQPSKASKRWKKKGKRPGRDWDLSWTEEFVAAGAFALGLYGFRGLYAQVPFLLALGLSVLFALGVLVAGRALRQRDFGLQNRVWKQNGKWTGAGISGGLLLASFVTLSLHSVVVQKHTRSGLRALLAAREISPSATGDDALRQQHLSDSAVALERAKTLGLFGNAALESQLGSLANALGDYQAAVGFFERALELNHRISGVHAPLGQALLRLQKPDVASQRLAEHVAKRPEDIRAARVLADALIMQRDLQAVEPVLEQLLERQGQPELSPKDWARTLSDLERVRSMR